MNNFFDFLAKVNIVFIVLYLVYIAFLSKNTFHNLNRMLLLFIITASIILPIITFDFNYININFIPHKTLIENNHLFINEEIGTATNIQNSFWVTNSIFYLIYGLGVAFILGRLAFNISFLVKIKNNSPKEADGRFLLIYSKVNSYFSFFNWIFIPKKKKEICDHSIINHEKLHGIKNHSVDLLITEVFKALLWFNPFVYFFQKNVKTVHEYQVDMAVLKKESLISYLQIILNNLPHQNKVKIYNYFGELTIKKRINMITKNKSSNWYLLRYALLLPVITFLLMSFNYKNNNSLENIPSILPIKKGEFYKISSGFGMRHHPILKVKRMHNGVDFSAKMGTEIRATADGIVTFANHNKGYGKMVVIKHNDVYETIYSQMKDFTVSNGAKVKKGQVIGYVGMSGNSSGPHLHYEVIKNKKNVNPEDFFIIK